MAGVPGRPVLLYDGRCGFCSAAAGFLTRWVRPAPRGEPAWDVLPWQRADLAALGVAAEACRQAVQWVVPPGRPGSGEPRSGAAAVAAALRAGRIPWVPLGWLLDAPVLRRVAALGYRFVAARRDRLPGHPTL